MWLTLILEPTLRRALPSGAADASAGTNARPADTARMIERMEFPPVTVVRYLTLRWRSSPPQVPLILASSCQAGSLPGKDASRLRCLTIVGHERTSLVLD